MPFEHQLSLLVDYDSVPVQYISAFTAMLFIRVIL